MDRAEIQRWMSAAADGDRAAIDPLFKALWPIAVAYASRFLGDLALAEDAAQEALVKLFGQLAMFDRERDALTWALTPYDLAMPHGPAPEATPSRRLRRAGTRDRSYDRRLDDRGGTRARTRGDRNARGPRSARSRRDRRIDHR